LQHCGQSHNVGVPMRILEVVPYLSTVSIAVGQDEIIYQTAAGRGPQVSIYSSDEQAPSRSDPAIGRAGCHHLSIRGDPGGCRILSDVEADPLGWPDSIG